MSTSEPLSGPARITTGPAWALAGLLIAVVVGLVALGAWSATGGPAFRLDDAYIVLNNAAAIVGGDASFPEVRPLHGSTSLLHTLAVFLLGLAMPPDAALFWLAWGAVLAQALAALFLARELQLSLAFGLGLAALTATAGDLIRVQVNGLETGWMVAAILWVLALAATRPTRPSVAILAGCLPFIRPELAILSIVLLAHGLWHIRSRSDRRAAMAFAGTFLAVTGALCLLQYWLAGTFLPVTGDAKKYFFETSVMPWDERAALSGTTLMRFAFFAGGPLLLALLVPKGTLARLAVAFALVATLALAVMHTAILPQNWMRYLYFVLPVAVFSLAMLRASDAPGSRRATMLILVAGLAFNIAASVPRLGDHLGVLAAKRSTLEQTSDWINRNLEPETPLLIHDIGYVSWATSQRLFDIVGLRSPEAVPINRALRYQRGAEGQADALEAMIDVSGSCTLLVSDGWNSIANFTGSLRGRGWSVLPHPAGHPPGHQVYLLEHIDRRTCNGRD
ncbi:hypothetical protein [Histidinibacterium aquaticum]|uniref:Glycosyltransferase RgtA/B/C/D-like domain-containing protein n=1 Tax=Histidinibacterium aquaticum TaxID=2613962 RepID=A0A5J5GK44_9RHOB|nr:hypothetical protein [Histidinibacterium aquaticum]KAA9008033.1 hypothetical protein F3S47_11020 [Histidinibacterium aquaticum]